jgi:hypothetical protein
MIRFVILSLSVLFLGCAVLRASPAKNSGFLPHGELLVEEKERSPFNGNYFPDRKRFYDLKPTFTKIIILPVKTDYVEKRIFEDKSLELFREDRLEELNETARYFQGLLKSSFKNYPNHPMMVAENLTDDKMPTLKLELALVELEPTKATLNVLSTVAGFFLPGSGITKPFSTGSIAFEAILRDARTGEIYVEFKDRQSDKTSAFSIKDFEAYAHQRKIIEEWSAEIAALAATPDGVKVEGADLITLDPF